LKIHYEQGIEGVHQRRGPTAELLLSTATQGPQPIRHPRVILVARPSVQEFPFDGILPVELDQRLSLELVLDSVGFAGRGRESPN
jgi:hypothetical protein